MACSIQKRSRRSFEARFSRWVHEACEHVDGEVVAIDGKTLRRSYDRDSSKAAVHMEGSRSYGQRLGEGKRKAVDQMGGSIDMETEKGEGSRCTVRLPLVGQTEAA